MVWLDKVVEGFVRPQKNQNLVLCKANKRLLVMDYITDIPYKCIKSEFLWGFLNKSKLSLICVSQYLANIPAAALVLLKVQAWAKIKVWVH